MGVRDELLAIIEFCLFASTTIAWIADFVITSNKASLIIALLLVLIYIEIVKNWGWWRE